MVGYIDPTNHLNVIALCKYFGGIPFSVMERESRTYQDLALIHMATQAQLDYEDAIEQQEENNSRSTANKRSTNFRGKRKNLDSLDADRSRYEAEQAARFEALAEMEAKGQSWFALVDKQTKQS